MVTVTVELSWPAAEGARPLIVSRGRRPETPYPVVGTIEDGVPGVLAGSLIALVLAGALVSWRARHHRRLAVVNTPEVGL